MTALYSPVPGWLGPVAEDHGVRSLITFRDEATVLPVDEFGALSAFESTGADPDVVDGYTGLARAFTGAQGYRALDADNRLLLTQSVSVTFVLDWDLPSVTGVETVIARGVDGAVSEYRAWEVQLMSPSAGVGRLRWVWQDRGGAEQVQTGADFEVEAGLHLYALAREWLGDRFLLRYWLNGHLLAEVESMDLPVGGGVNAGVTIACAGDGAGNHIRALHGVLDFVAVYGHALVTEEVTFLYRRMASDQPAIYEALRALQPSGTARSRNEASLVQRHLRTRAAALGVLQGEVEQRRAAGLPDRAYGPRLEEWEFTTGQRPLPTDSIAVRRARVLAGLNLTRNLSKSATSERLAALIGGVTYLANGHIYEADFSDTHWPGYLGRMDQRGTIQYNGALAMSGTSSVDIDWPWCPRVEQAIEGEPVGISVGAHVATYTAASSVIAGVALFDHVSGAGIVIGKADSTGRIVRATLDPVNGFSAFTQLDASGVAGYLRIDLVAAGTVKLRWDASAFDNPGNSVEVAIAFSPTHVAVFTGASGAANASATFAEYYAYFPNSDRVYSWTAYRDPADPGPLDLNGARLIADRASAAHAEALVSTVQALRCGDAQNGAGHAPLGEGPAGFTAAFRELAAAEPAHIWLGTPDDLVAGNSLTAEVGASTGFADVHRRSPWGWRKLGYSNGTLSAHRAGTADVANFLAGRSSLVALVYNVRAYSAGTFQQLLSKRVQPSGTGKGWELVISPSQRLTFNLDDELGPVVGVQLPTAGTWVNPGWRAVALRWNATSGNITITNRLESASASFAGRDPTSAQLFAIGAGRGDVFAPSFDAAVCAVWHGAAVEAVNLTNLCIALEERA